MKLWEFVRNHTTRGACQCGKCIDAPSNPGEHQPTGHTADLIFFKVAAQGNPCPKDFKDLASSEFPHWFDGKEHSYIEMGGDMGDQGVALQTMGLGALLGAWQLLTPRTILPDVPDSLALQMAGMGLVSIQCNAH